MKRIIPIELLETAKLYGVTPAFNYDKNGIRWNYFSWITRKIEAIGLINLHHDQPRSLRKWVEDNYPDHPNLPGYSHQYFINAKKIVESLGYLIGLTIGWQPDIEGRVEEIVGIFQELANKKQFTYALNKLDEMMEDIKLGMIDAGELANLCGLKSNRTFPGKFSF